MISSPNELRSRSSRRLPIGRRIRLILRPIAAACFAVGALAAPAAAQWTRIAALPTTDVFAIRVVGDTIAAGVDSVAYVSVDAGATWHRSAKVAPGVVAVDALWIRNGRVYAGTFGQGVFVSDDLGASWQTFNQGLVGGFLDSQLDISDFELRGDSLVASTFGAGVYVRNLAGADTWHAFGNEFEPNQAPNVEDLALGGMRLLACTISNGNTFHRDPGDADWTVDFLVNGTLRPGMTSQMAFWTGNRWVVGTNSGVFLSPNGEAPWTRSTTSPAHPSWSTFAQLGQTLVAAFTVVDTILVEESHDEGDTWILKEIIRGSFAYQLAVHGDRLYAARSDGLWIRTSGVASVEAGPRSNLHFALAVQPVRDVARFRFVLPQAAGATLELFDVMGRRAADRITGFWSAGPHELAVSERGLQPGVYSARAMRRGIDRSRQP
jgi:hypothetical protein